MTAESCEVIGGVDTHKDTHHAAVVDTCGRLLGDASFPTHRAGLQQLLAWLRGHGALLKVGVEGTGTYGSELARMLRSEGVSVAEVNRPNRSLRRARGKSDPIDAQAAARAALSGQASAEPKDSTGIVEAIRVLRVTREGAVKARTAALNQLKDLLVTAPDELRQALRGLSQQQLLRRCAELPVDPTRLHEPTEALRAALRQIATRVNTLTEEINTTSTQLNALVHQAAPHTSSLHGVGAETAGQLLITAGQNPTRLHNEAAFAHLCAAAPIPASSGKTHRHRLNTGGDRDANRALHVITVVRMRWCPTTRAYVTRRTTEGLSKKDIMRCLKRYIARQIYRALSHDLDKLADTT